MITFNNHYSISRFHYYYYYYYDEYKVFHNENRLDGHSEYYDKCFKYYIDGTRSYIRDVQEANSLQKNRVINDII
jgi:hypothetical protein